MRVANYIVVVAAAVTQANDSFDFLEPFFWPSPCWSPPLTYGLLILVLRDLTKKSLKSVEQYLQRSPHCISSNFQHQHNYNILTDVPTTALFCILLKCISSKLDKKMLLQTCLCNRIWNAETAFPEKSRWVLSVIESYTEHQLQFPLRLSCVAKTTSISRRTMIEDIREDYARVFFSCHFRV